MKSCGLLRLLPVARLAWPGQSGRLFGDFIMLSLDNALQPGTPGPHELVPSRYALRVGEIDVLVVSDGVLPLPTATMTTNVDPAERAAWLNDMFLPQDAFDWPLNVAVVRS